MQCIRALLFTSNFLFLFAGVIFTGLSCYFWFGNNLGEWYDDSMFKTVMYGTISFAASVTVISFLGCCGALKWSRMILGLYMLLMLLAILAEVFLGVMVMINYDADNAKETTEEMMLDSMGKYTSDEGTRNVWDTYQSKMECCGVTNPIDWTTVVGKVPDSCCKTFTNPLSVCVDYYTTGCSTATMETIESNMTFILYFSATVLSIQIFDLCLASIAMKLMDRSVSYA